MLTNPVLQLVARQHHRSTGRRLAKGAIIGIAIAAFCVVAFTCLLLWCCCCRGRKKSPQTSYAGQVGNPQGGFLSRFTGGRRQHQQPPMGQPGYGAHQYPGGGYAQGPHQEGGYYR